MNRDETRRDERGSRDPHYRSGPDTLRTELYSSGNFNTGYSRFRFLHHRGGGGAGGNCSTVVRGTLRVLRRVRLGGVLRCALSWIVGRVRDRDNVVSGSASQRRRRLRRLGHGPTWSGTKWTIAYHPPATWDHSIIIVEIGGRNPG
jgi:hypothetical protein